MLTHAQQIEDQNKLLAAMPKQMGETMGDLASMVELQQAWVKQLWGVTPTPTAMLALATTASLAQT